MPPLPTRRPLKIFAADPMQGRSAGNRITIDIPYEPLPFPGWGGWGSRTPGGGSQTPGDGSQKPSGTAPAWTAPPRRGPFGERIAVLDYDGAAGKAYESVDLDSPEVLIRGGLDPDESSPLFHQQMVYAVAMRTLENFDRALGRRLNLTRRGRPLRLFPHAFRGQNAYYASDLHAVLFGYFQADRRSPGRNIPGQNVFTCLSHDIIAHEVTHAIVHRLRRYFLEPSNRDVLAFHEAFADLVAIFQHFSFQELLRDEIQTTRSNLGRAKRLHELAQQFGYATGKGRALRTAVDPAQPGGEAPDATLYQTMLEPHERGAILVAAVFDGFMQTYENRVRDLIRIATGGTGRLPEGDMHPDLVNRIAGEAARTAQSILTMCIRAFDYLPPVDVTFSDFLRAVVTADFDLLPQDEHGQRAAVIEGFRRRGIYPEDAASLAEESCRWPEAEGLPPLPVAATDIAYEMLVEAETYGRGSRSTRDAEVLESFTPTPFSSAQSRKQEREEREEQESESLGTLAALQDESVAVDKTARALWGWAHQNRAALGLSGDTMWLAGFHPVFRVGNNGRLLVELVAEFAQRSAGADAAALGGLELRGGTTVIASVDGRVRYAIRKPLPGALSAEAGKVGEARRDRQLELVRAWDRRDAAVAYMSAEARANRMRLRAQQAALHVEVSS